MLPEAGGTCCLGMHGILAGGRRLLVGGRRPAHLLSRDRGGRRGEKEGGIISISTFYQK